VFEDSRLGDYYHQVGNHAQTLGFAGNCLPKDLWAKITDPSTPESISDFLKEVDAFNEILQSIHTIEGKGTFMKHFPPKQRP
jgi:UDP-glucose 6-dehydrogenase